MALLGCPPEIGQRVATGMAALLEGIEAEDGNKMISEAMLELVTLKRTQPRQRTSPHCCCGIRPNSMNWRWSTRWRGHYGAGIEFQQN